MATKRPIYDVDYDDNYDPVQIMIVNGQLLSIVLYKSSEANINISLVLINSQIFIALQSILCNCCSDTFLNSKFISSCLWCLQPKSRGGGMAKVPVKRCPRLPMHLSCASVLHLAQSWSCYLIDSAVAALCTWSNWRLVVFLPQVVLHSDNSHVACLGRQIFAEKNMQKQLAYGLSL